MLNQAAGDRQILAKQLNISKEQLSHVTSSNEGEGLLFYGNIIIPFRDRFDKNLKIYSYLTTKPEEVEQRKKAEEALKQEQMGFGRHMKKPGSSPKPETTENPGHLSDLQKAEADYQRLQEILKSGIRTDDDRAFIESLPGTRKDVNGKYYVRPDLVRKGASHE